MSETSNSSHTDCSVKIQSASQNITEEIKSNKEIRGDVGFSRPHKFRATTTAYPHPIERMYAIKPTVYPLNGAREPFELHVEFGGSQPELSATPAFETGTL